MHNESRFGDDAGSDILKLSPSGVTFPRPVEVTFYYEAGPANTVFLERFNEASNAWEAKGRLPNVAARRRAVFNVSSFSYWRVRLHDELNYAATPRPSSNAAPVSIATPVSIAAPASALLPMSPPPDPVPGSQGRAMLLGVIGAAVVILLCLLVCYFCAGRSPANDPMQSHYCPPHPAPRHDVYGGTACHIDMPYMPGAGHMPYTPGAGHMQPPGWRGPTYGYAEHGSYVYCISHNPHAQAPDAATMPCYSSLPYEDCSRGGGVGWRQ